MNEHEELAETGSPDHAGGAVERDIGARFDTVARAVALGEPSEMLETVRAAATKRHRRRQAVGAIVAVGALGASGVVLANVSRGNDGDLVVSAPVTDPLVESDEEAAEPTESGDVTAQDAAADAAEAPAATAPGVLRVTPTNREISSDSELVIEQDVGYGAVQLYPWKGGFLSIREYFLPQPLPVELPESVTEQFPPEVLDLFPDGLPPTIQEATEILQEAGLYDVVSEIVLADPDVSAAIYSQQSEMIRTVRFSEDGIEWNDIESAFPDDDAFYSVVSTGDRLAFMSSEYPDAPDGGHVDGPSTVTVWSSTDLLEWQSQEIVVPKNNEGLPDFVSYASEPAQLAANDAGWVLPFYAFPSVDAMSLIEDDDLVAQLDAGELYASGGLDEDGVIIDIYDPNVDNERSGPDPALRLDLTWDELGVDTPPASLWSGSGESISYTAAWGAAPVEVDRTAAGGQGFQQVLAVRDGFVSVGGNVELSIDGVNWSPVDLPVDGYVDWVLDTDGALVMAITDAAGEQQLFVFDAASSTYTTLDLAELAQGVFPQQTGPGFVMLAQYDDGGSAEAYGPGGSIAVVEADGYRFELSISGGLGDGPTASYTLTALGTGEVVSSESLSEDSFDFEFASEEYDGDVEGFRLFDPESGDELLFATFESMTYTPLDADGEALGEVDGSVFAQEYSEPAMFVVAAVGDGLIVEQLSEGGGLGFGVSSVAANDDVVLIADYNGSFVRLTPAG